MECPGLEGPAEPDSPSPCPCLSSVLGHPPLPTLVTFPSSALWGVPLSPLFRPTEKGPLSVCTQRAKFLPHSQTVPFGAPPMHLRRHRVGSLAEWSRVPNPRTGSPMKAGSPRISWPNWMMGWTTPGLEGPLGAVPILKVAQIPISPLSNAHHPALASWPPSVHLVFSASLFYQG